MLNLLQSSKILPHTFHIKQHPFRQSKRPGCVTCLTGCGAKVRKLFFFSFCLFNLILCWMLFLATILWRMAKYILKTTQTSGSKIKHWCLMQWCTTVTGVKFWQKRVSSSPDCLRMLVMKRFNTCNVQSRGILEPLTPKTKLCDNRFYVHCVKQYPLCANRWLR